MTTTLTKAAMPMLAREASFEPRTWNDETRTVEMVWTTGARVRRQDWLDGDFDEELVVSDETVDMRRLVSGHAPLLAAHNSRSLSDVIGVVESAWILGPNGRKEGRAKVRFSERADVAPVLTDVRNGILKNVSVGYRVLKWEKRQEKGDEVPVMRAVRWEPMEISLVPMGADAAAQVRGRPEKYATEIEEITAMNAPSAEAAVTAAGNVLPNMTTFPDGTSFLSGTSGMGAAGGGNGAPEPPAPAPEPPAPAPAPEPQQPAAQSNSNSNSNAIQAILDLRAAPDLRALAQEAAQEERTRIAGITSACRTWRIDPKHGDKLVADGVALDVARQRLVDLWAASQEDTVVNAPVHLIRDEGETKLRALIDSMLYRTGNGPLSEVAKAHGFEFHKLVDVARECLEANGVRTRGMSPRNIAGMAMQPGYTRLGGLHTTSDFVNVLQSTLGTSLRKAYDLAPATFQTWARKATVPDYRSVTRVQLSSVSRLMGVNEHGEYKRGTLTDSKEAYAIAKYGEIIGITREVIVNDYLDALSRIPAALAAAARALESDLVYKQLLANAVMGDGVALFNAAHGNEDAAAAISATSLSTGLTLMALQAHTNGSPMNLSPSYLLVPPQLRAVADQLINGTFTPAQVSNVVPNYLRGLQVITEARLSTGVTVDGVLTAGDTNGWYLIADPGTIDTVEYAYMEGEEGLYTETRNGFDIDGVEFKVRLDFGAKALDWRGMVRNVGA